MPIDRRTFLGISTALATLRAAPALAAAQAATVEAPMRRKIPGTNEQLPVIGMGTADTFNVGRTSEERAPLGEVLAMLLQRIPHAVVDTAPSYGSAEVVTGDLLQAANARRNVFVATKISSGAPNAIEQFTQSRADLRSDVVDLLQVHNLIDWQNNLKLLRQLKAQGKTRYIGITHYREDAHDTLAQILRTEKVDFLQVNYSLAERNAEKTLLPLCEERGVAVLINRPFQDGRLFAAVRGKPLPDWAGEIDCTSWGQLFLKFIVSHPAVTAAIPATSKPKNMADNLGAAFGRMPDTRERARIAAALA
ncbi:aldo/keto reductase [Cupriavidus pauculus]|jgi:diketogulonate reductase-like aldo/keto reductase|uniref:aldo/keto reductase n=2 Tax=Cupriavidus pauculus TaxID=82633 RepID=UPI0012460C7E|nr:aldo/keto reductase [Cupriavidus pauculus]KAB0602707.1 aldo/keto reductase [Cupriavidus pauculus]UAL02847.1 aldo/keto reductase [Cupriavidus pauculus]